jgi:hypothetical protein
VEESARDCGELGEDVTRRGSILAALNPRAELADRGQYVDVVAPDKVLCVRQKEAMRQVTSNQVRWMANGRTGPCNARMICLPAPC